MIFQSWPWVRAELLDSAYVKSRNGNAAPSSNQMTTRSPRGLMLPCPRQDHRCDRKLRFGGRANPAGANAPVAESHSQSHFCWDSILKAVPASVGLGLGLGNVCNRVLPFPREGGPTGGQAAQGAARKSPRLRAQARCLGFAKGDQEAR